jgi:phage N-6-adenine-methyltransferase
MSDHWQTPKDFYDRLDREFSFTLDPCPLSENPIVDGLTRSWVDEIVFCNPPYSAIDKWIEKARYESRKNNVVVVMLLPANRTDRKWFHRFCMAADEIRFVNGRINFVRKGEQPSRSNHPSMLVIFNGSSPEKLKVSSMCAKTEKNERLKL